MLKFVSTNSTIAGVFLEHDYVGQGWLYFLCSLLYGWLSLLFATILNAEIFIELLHEGFSLHSLFLLFVPWMMLVLGKVKASTFLYAFVADTCIVGFLFCFAFLIFHLILLYHGVTTKEWFGGHASNNDKGWKRNVKNFLGERWYLVWLSPWISSKLPGDGIHFEPGYLFVTEPSMMSTQ
uniref:Protein S-acyltransferase n=1 Tax=Pyxicephalus adspersus TaxID=30357 RepID=A0AAV3A4Z6_PYXAD|nr:TPA: hypothetical protein GDO54_002603 [Pyxicephalus adspersus]